MKTIDTQNTDTLARVDQAEKLRLMVKQTKPNATVLAVTSGKGGVGKSNVALNLALCLKAARKDVTLLDADLGLANIDLLIGLKTRHTLEQVITGKKNIEQIIQRGPAGLKLICGAAGIAQLADINEFQRRQLVNELAMIEHKTDIIIIDTGAGIAKNVLAFCARADHTLVVTTPEPTSIADAYAMVKAVALMRTGAKISLLVNCAQSRDEAKKVFQRIAQVARQFLSIPVYNAGYILRDPHVHDAVVQQEPVVLAYPRCQASLCMLAIAQKWARSAVAETPQGGFFKKVANWFF